MKPSELWTDPRGRVVMLCPFPPPMVGAAKNSVLVKEALQASGLQVITLTTSVSEGSAHARSVKYHLRRMFRLLHNSLKIARFCSKRADPFYIVPDGGWGVWYTFLYTCIITILTRGPVFLHHRNFLNMTRRHPALAGINALLQQRANHVFLEEEMRRLFIRNYGAPSNTFIVRNAATCDVPSSSPIRNEGPIVIGFLSNLNLDKGFDVVADTFLLAALVDRGLHFYVAGQPTDEEAQTIIKKLENRLGSRFKYFGPVHGRKKEDFFSALDVFVFPSRYKLEAQPNVLYEAASRGVTIIATAHACIPFMLDDIPLRLIEADEGELEKRFSAAVLEEATLLSDPRLRQTRKQAIIRDFDLLKSAADVEFDRLIASIAEYARASDPAPRNTESSAPESLHH